MLSLPFFLYVTKTEKHFISKALFLLMYIDMLTPTMHTILL